MEPPGKLDCPPPRSKKELPVEGAPSVSGSEKTSHMTVTKQHSLLKHMISLAKTHDLNKTQTPKALY